MINAHVRLPDGSYETFTSLIEAARALRESQSQIWVDMEAPDEWALALLGEAFSLHPLAIEDCLHGEQRPHIDPYDGHIFMVLYGLSLGDENELIGARELAMFCSSQFLITIHHEPMDAIGHIHERCRRDPENVLGRGMDHLLYMISDAVIDGYQPLLDRFEAEATHLEDTALTDPQADMLERISDLRSQLLQVRRFLTPQREAVHQLARGEYTFIGRNIRPYFRDVLDHLIRITEDIDIYREQVTAARDLFMSALSHRTNEIMRRMTMFASVMLPLTLISGVYGMNFVRLWPSVDNPNGFWIIIGIMAALSGVLIFWFRRWGWV